MQAEIIVGLDEVGRGAIAGPVVVGAVVDPPSFVLEELWQQLGLEGLRDSKKLSQRQREKAFGFLERSVQWSVGLAKASEIDEIGLSEALRRAAGRAIDGLKLPIIGQISADASLFHPYEDTIPTTRTVKGDEQVGCIALASIMAKVWRDRWMREANLGYPGYGFDKHVGYGTAFHWKCLGELGPSLLHRQLFLRKFKQRS